MTTWRIIRCTSGQERRAERHLERMGYPHGWHPVEKIRIREAVYQRMVRAAKKLPSWTGKKPERFKIRPFIHGYVFVPADDIDTHRIKGQHTPQLWMDVVCVDDKPYSLTNADMAAMKQVPERLKQMLDEIERKAREEWEAKRPQVGKTAKIVDGVFQGNDGKVTSVSPGYVEVDIGALIGRVKVPEQMVERVA